MFHAEPVNNEQPGSRPASVITYLRSIRLPHCSHVAVSIRFLVRSDIFSVVRGLVPTSVAEQVFHAQSVLAKSRPAISLVSPKPGRHR